MNNSLGISQFQEETPGKEERLRERQAKLVRVIEAIDLLSTNKEWSTLKEEVFDQALDSIEAGIRIESEKATINTPAIYRLQGERKWAKKYSDLTSIRNVYRLELENIKQQLNPATHG